MLIKVSSGGCGRVARWSQGLLGEGMWYRWVQETCGRSRVSPPAISWTGKCLGNRVDKDIFTWENADEGLFPPSPSTEEELFYKKKLALTLIERDYSLM